MRIVAEQARLDVEARKTIAIHRKTRDLFIGKAGADRQRFKILALLEQALEAAAVARLNFDNHGQIIERFVEIADPRRHDLERIGRIIGGQYFTVAIENQSAVGYDRQHRNTIGFCERVKVLALDDLQIHHASGEDGEGEDDAKAGEQCACAEHSKLRFTILDGGADHRVFAFPRTVTASASPWCGWVLAGSGVRSL